MQQETQDFPNILNGAYKSFRSACVCVSLCLVFRLLMPAPSTAFRSSHAGAVITSPACRGEGPASRPAEGCRPYVPIRRKDRKKQPVPSAVGGKDGLFPFIGPGNAGFPEKQAAPCYKVTCYKPICKLLFTFFKVSLSFVTCNTRTVAHTVRPYRRVNPDS